MPVRVVAAIHVVGLHVPLNVEITGIVFDVVERTVRHIARSIGVIHITRDQITDHAQRGGFIDAELVVLRIECRRDFQHAVATEFHTAEVRERASQNRLVIGGQRIADHGDAAVAVLCVQVVGQGDHAVRRVGTEHELPAVETGVTVVPCEVCAAFEGDGEVSATGCETTALLIPEDFTSTRADVLVQHAIGLNDRGTVVPWFSSVMTEIDHIGATQSDAVCPDIQRTAADLHVAGVAAVVAGQSQCPGTLILVDFVAPSQVAGKGGHAAAAPGLNIGARVNLNRIGDRHVVGRIGGAQVETLAVKTLIVAAVIELTIHAAALRCKRNGQVSAVSSEATLIVPIHLSCLIIRSDLAGKGAAGPQDTIPEAHGGLSWQSRSIIRHENRRVSDICIPGVGVGARQIGVCASIGRVPSDAIAIHIDITVG